MNDDASSAPSILTRMLDLRRVSPFDQLEESELVLIANAAELRDIAPGQIAHSGSRPLSALWVTVAGRLHDAEARPAPVILGLPALLSGTDTGRLEGGPDGARLAVIRNGFFFAFLRECPAFAHGLLISPGLEPPANP